MSSFEMNLTLALPLLLGAPLAAQGQASQDPGTEQGTEFLSEADPFAEASQRILGQLEEATLLLSREQQRIMSEKLPLTRDLNALESELTEVRLEFNDVSSQLSSRTLNLANLGKVIQQRKDEVTYLADLLTMYIRNFEGRLHIAEVKRYEAALDEAKLAVENPALDRKAVFKAQTDMIELSLSRLEGALGGTKFQGKAVDDSGTIKPGHFVMMGPAAIFLAVDGSPVGTAIERVGSLEPTVVPFSEPANADAAKALVSAGQGNFPLDPTLGDAFKVEATKVTFLEHVKKGGVVMYPIFGMAGAAFLVALFKWLTMAFIRKPSRKKIEALLDAVAEGDEEGAQRRARKVGGPVGRMLQVGASNMREPRELVEEILYESVLKSRIKLNGFLPFIAVCAASAPLLGLLGTVTGIIDTFKMINIFGSGDVKSLSGGISAALITTQFGLIVAIPSLLLHAFLSRKARGIVGQMESAAMAFVNQLAKTPLTNTHVVMPTGGSQAASAPSTSVAPDPQLVRAQVSEILGELLDPLVDKNSNLGKA